MASDSEDEILEDVDAICGWGAADFDDELEGQARRKAVGKVTVKRKSRKALSTSKSASGLATLPNTTQTQHPQDSTCRLSIEKPVEPPVRQPQQSENSSKERRPRRKTKPKQPHEAKQQSNPKPSPRTLSLKEEHAAIAASGRERRMRIVAAAMASNVPRKPGIASVVSASFDGDSDEEQEGQEMTSRRRNEEWMPSSAPQNQLQIKLPRVSEPSTAPAGLAEIPKKIHPPLPLLSIKPDCGGNEIRLLGKGGLSSDAPQHWRRHRQQKSSLLPSRDVSDNWASNFPPALRRSRSPRKYQAESPQASNSSGSSFSKVVRVPLAPRQEYSTPRHLEELLPLIHHTGEDSDLAVGVVKVPDTSVAMPNKAPVARADEKEGGDDDDEGWTECYDDPDVLAKSMAGLIQALSTFAADGKRTKDSKPGKHKRRRPKLQHAQQLFPPNPPVLRLPPPGEIKVTSGRAPITEGQQASEPSARRRKQRKLRNKPSVSSNHATKDQVP